MRPLGVLGLIAAVTWLAGDAVLVGVAMTSFEVLRELLGEAEGRRAAGRVFGAILAWWSILAWGPFALVATALCVRAGAGWERGRRVAPIAAGLLTLILGGLHGYGHHLVGAVAATRDALPATTEPSEDATFQALHRRSERVFALEALAILAAVLILIPMTASGGTRRSVDAPA